MERWSRILLALAVLTGVFFLAFDFDRAATGQGFRMGGRRVGRVPPRPGAEDEVVDGVFLPPDRTAKRRLEAAEEMIGEKRYGESVRYLGSLLEGSEDFFFRPEGSGTVYRSLKAEAGRLIAGLPSDGRESYELQFGAKARRMLDDAIASGNLADLAEVSRRFFYTEAGAEASLLLARQHLDGGQPLAAALLFARLHDSPDLARRFEPTLSLYLATAWLRAGMREQAQAALVALKRDGHKGQVHVAGQTVALFENDAGALPWLEKQVGQSREIHHVEGEDWLMYRGDARHNASSRGGRPLLNPRWRVRVAHHPTIEQRVAQLRQRFADDQDVAPLPTLHPLAVGNLVLVRDSRSLLAIDFTTGKLVWPAEPLGESSLDHWLSFSAQPQQVGQMQLAQFVEQRIWDDPTYGTMSSDGEQVFIVEDPGNAIASQPTIVRARWQHQPSAGPRPFNLLIARELKTEGKLKWEVGGATGEDEPKLAGAFFLGPPLVLQGRLYVLAEMKGQEIRLVALSAKTGMLDWWQQLCVVEQDPDRRPGGASPSFADGVLVCPTSADAVVAVDATTRNLLWGYQYPRAQQINFNHLNAIRINNFPMIRRAGDRWADGTVTIGDGKVVLTPIESDFLYVLNLINGEVQWKIERGSNLYVACIDSGNVILVGRSLVTAYPMAGGEPVWVCPTTSPDLADGGMPSGRGFQTGHDYFLPLASGEVVQIDLTQGKVTSRAKSRSGEAPGNLICHRGEVISQGSNFIERFDQIDLLQREVTQKLAQTPDDAKSLSRLGEIKFDEGDLQQSIDLSRRSFELSPNDHTRGLLVSSLLEGLRRDFAGTRAKAAELEKLIDEQSDRNVYLRLVAAGLKQSGQSLAAYDAYVSLLEEPATTDRDSLEPAGEGLRVRRQRWVESELGDLRAHASPADVEQLDQRVAARLQAAIDADSTAALKQFLEVFGTHPLAAAARERLVSQLSGAGTLMERELLLRRLAQSPDENQARAAAARLAALFDEAVRPDLSIFYYRQLRDEWADIPCLDGKTGAELIAALPADAPVQKLLSAADGWPAGAVTSKEGGSRSLGNNRPQRSFVLNSYGPVAPYFAGMTVSLDPQQQTIVGHDAMGIERFKAQLSEPDPHRGYGWNGAGFNVPMLNYVRSSGNLLVMWTGQHVLAVDTLRPGVNQKRVQWTKPLTDEVPGLPTQGGYHQTQLNAPWGGVPPRMVAQDPYNHVIGTMGPVNFDGICFQRFRDLNCVDPLSGELLWTRKNVPVGCDVFGDEELLFAAPPEGGDALVLRALDGQLLGKRPVGPLRQRMTTVGRCTLVWEPVDSQQVVTLRDVWSGEAKWTYTFAAGAKGAVITDEVVGVLEPSGRFTLVRLADGHKLVEQRLDAEETLTSICLLRSSDQYLLLTNSPATGMDSTLNVQPINGGLNNDPLISGRIYAFDRTSGKTLWPRPVVVQQQGLVLTQPCELPLLFFLSSRTRNNPAGQPEARSGVQVIDKRNGRVWFKREDLPLITNFEISGDREAKTVTLLLPGTMFTFRLTDEPLPPLAEVPPPPKPGFLGGLGSAIKRSIERSAQPIGDIVERGFSRELEGDADDD
jgi:outer membrane protein assembly factor BamB